MLRKSSILLGVVGIAGAGMLAFNLTSLSPATEAQASQPLPTDASMMSLLNDMDQVLKRNHNARMSVIDAAKNKADLASACLELKAAHDEYLKHSTVFENATRQRIEDKSIDIKKGKNLLAGALSLRRNFEGVDYRMLEAFCRPRGHNLI